MHGEVKMSRSDAYSQSVERGMVVARLRIGLIVAWACGLTLIIASVVTEILTNVHAALLPAVLANSDMHLGIFVAGEGFIVLGFWLQVLKSTTGNRSGVTGVPSTRPRWSTAFWIIFVVVVSLILALSVIPMIVLLASPALSPQFNGTASIDAVAAFANWIWGTMAFGYWVIRRSNRNQQTAR